MIRQLLALPEAAGLDLDDPASTAVASAIIQRKRFLRALYTDWYSALESAASQAPEGQRLELGSGGGFFKSINPAVITSELFPVPNADLLCSAEQLPFKSQSIAVIYAVDVFHHIAAPRHFLSEAVRCLKSGGRLLMIEPYNSVWSRWVWRRLHHEPFEPDASWELPRKGPLSGANSAAPWIVFERDRATFERDFPNLRIERIRPFMPVSYLLSGGVSMRALVPGGSYRLVRGFEKMLGPFERRLGMFAQIEVSRV